MRSDELQTSMEGTLTDPWTRAKAEGKTIFEALLERFPPPAAWLYHGHSADDIEGFREKWPEAVKKWLDWTSSKARKTVITPAAARVLTPRYAGDILVAHYVLEESTETYRGDAAGNLIALLFCGRVHTVHKVNDQTIWCITDGGWTEGYDVTTLLTPSDN